MRRPAESDYHGICDTDGKRRGVHDRDGGHRRQARKRPVADDGLGEGRSQRRSRGGEDRPVGVQRVRSGVDAVRSDRPREGRGRQGFRGRGGALPHPCHKAGLARGSPEIQGPGGSRHQPQELRGGRRSLPQCPEDRSLVAGGALQPRAHPRRDGRIPERHRGDEKVPDARPRRRGRPGGAGQDLRMGRTCRKTAGHGKALRGGVDLKISSIRRFRSGNAILSGLLAAALFAYPAFAEAVQPPPPPPAKVTPPAMTAPAALRQIREGLNSAGIRGGDERFRHHLENITVTLTGFSYTEVDDVARWATQPRSRSFVYSGIPAFSVEYHSPFFPNSPTGYRTTFQPPIWWNRDKEGYARGFVDAVNAIRYYSSGADLADDAPLFAKFQEEARGWRAIPVKPGLPEGVRRSQILAEDAIRNKSFEEA